MKVKDIYLKTMGFVWMKLGLGMLTVLLSAIWLGILTGIAILFPSGGMIVVSLVLWMIGTGAINSIVNHYFGYLVKAGHVAIITMAVTTGSIPENQFEVAKEMVKKRFITSNVYFAVDKLVSGSVSQIQNGLQKVDNLLGNVPGVSTIISILQMFTKIALGYVDECCLGYTFYKKDDGAFKSAADGVVIYFQNWKVLLKNAAMTTLTVIVFTFVAWILPFLVLGGVFTVLAWPKWIAFLIAVMIAIAVKYAFIDSFMMVKMMTAYMQVAPSTTITFDLYGKLCNLSSRFKNLFGKAQEEAPVFTTQQATQSMSQYARI